MTVLPQAHCGAGPGVSKHASDHAFMGSLALEFLKGDRDSSPHWLRSKNGDTFLLDKGFQPSSLSCTANVPSEVALYVLDQCWLVADMFSRARAGS